MANQGRLVEDYKLSDEHKSFLERFKKVKRFQNILGAESERLSREMQQVSGLMILLDQAAQGIDVPTNILRGFADQQFVEDQPTDPTSFEELGIPY